MEHVSLEIDHRPFEVHSIAGREAISRLFRLDLVASAPASSFARSVGTASPSGGRSVGTASPSGGRGLLGQPALVRLTSGSGQQRTISGIVTAASASWDTHGTALALTVEPRASFAAHRRSCRVFHDTTAPEATARILSEHGCPVRLALTEAYERREYTAQYREDDWAFLSRWLEDEGIYLWFDHAEDSAPCLSDRSPSAPDIEGDPVLPFAYESGAHAEREVVHELARQVAMTPTRFSVGSFDPRRPALKLSAARGGGALEHYEASGGGPRSPEGCERLARLLAERAACLRDTVTGVSTSVRLAPGRLFRVEGHPELSGRWLVTAVTYRAVARSRSEKTPIEPYTCRFEALRAEVPYRPQAVTPRALQPGLQTGMVVGPPGREAHFDAEGRARVQHCWDREGPEDDRAGKWMRVAQRATAGSMLLPRMGFTVLTFNEEGAIDEPTILGRLHDSQQPPSYGLPEHKTRVVFKTATLPADGSTNELHFEDAKGREQLFMNASRDMRVHVQNDELATIHNDLARGIGRDRAVAVGAHTSERVSRDQTISIGGDQAWHTDEVQARHVGGNEAVTIAGNASLKTGESAAASAAKTREVRVGVALIDASLGTIALTSQADYTLRAGGGVAQIAAKGLSEQVSGIAAEGVGGAKLEFVGGSRNISARQLLVETVGITLRVEAGEQLIELAEASFDLTAGALTLDAPLLSVTATDQIKLVSGSAALVLKPDSAVLSGDALHLRSGTVLETLSKLITHN